MKILIVLSTAGMLLAATATLPAGIPAGAVPIGPHSYRATRPDGTAWIYRVSPFGITGKPDKPAAPDAGNRAPESVKATAAGEMVRFERATPMGIVRWQKKKSELNKMEQAVWERDSAARGAAQE
jgi:hypothetical protein